MVNIPTITPTEIASGFHALSDPLRIQVIELLRSQEFCVCELHDRTSFPYFVKKRYF